MRRIHMFILALAVSLGVAKTASAQDFGLGLMVGEPTGLSAQFALTGADALNGAVGFNILDEGRLYIHLDYIRTLAELASTSSVVIPFYFGIGGFVAADKNASVGARVPFGIQFDFTSAPIHIFAEIAFRLRLIEDIKAGAAGALGFRYFF